MAVKLAARLAAMKDSGKVLVWVDLCALLLEQGEMKLTVPMLVGRLAYCWAVMSVYLMDDDLESCWAGY